MIEPSNKQVPVLKPGDHVAWQIGRSRFRGVVVEDRGRFGPDDEQVVAIRTGDGSYERPESVFELPAMYLELA